MKKVGLILEGGAQRGIFTSGVLDYFMEQKFQVPYVLGASAGSCNGISYVSGQALRTKECMLDAQLDNELYGVRTMLRTGHFMNMDLIFNRFPNELYPFDFDTYEKSPMRCLMTTTNCLTGKAEYLEEYQDHEKINRICRASSSMPFAAPVVEIDGVPMMDGGIADSIPVRKAIDDGYDFNIVILTRQRGYLKKEKSNSSKLARICFRKYPKLVKAIMNRNKIYNHTMALVDHLEQKGKAFVIRPDEVMVSRTEKDLEKLERFYWHGYEKAKEIWPTLQDWLAVREECESSKYKKEERENEK